MCPTNSSTESKAESNLAIEGWTSNFSAWRLLVLTELATLFSTVIAVFYPYGTSLADSTHGSIVAAVLWIVAQSFFLILPGLLLGLATLKISRGPKVNRRLTICASVWVFAVPLLVLCDNVSFGWISERFLSRSVARVLGELPQRLAAHVPLSTWMFAACLLTGFVVFVATAWWLSGRLAKLLESESMGSSVIANRLLRPWVVVVLLIAVATVFSIPAALNWRTTSGEMYAGSARHPFCSVYLVPSANVGSYDELVTPQSTDTVGTMREILAGLDQRHAMLFVDGKAGDQPDVVMVVIESLRHELVDPEIMPELSGIAARGIHCRNHFSSGNATNHGFFSLLNGLDATWYPRAVRKAPILNRLFREAGYEIGFFAAHNDWVKFHMDGFLNRQQFDRFEVEKPSWLESDRRATQSAVNFLDAPRESRRPRLAFLYLYSTHANYHSYAKDQVFQPAAGDRFLIPYQKSDVPQVWNRYKNSARSVDRFLSSVMQDDRVVIVTGDHGESFLEDGVCGHGVRISRYQNMTPAVIYVPNRTAQTIDAPTTHADVLPTLLSATGISTSDPDVLDGWNLMDADEDDLKDRVVLTRNYLSDDCGLIQQAESASDVFAYRAAISLNQWTATALNAIDPFGNETEGDARASTQRLQKWIADRFGDVSTAGF